MVRALLISVVALLIAFPALGQQATFFIERIEVRNARRVSPSLILSETLLREGTEVSEEQLAAASARLTRLPFLLSAELALEKGSDRGRHVLVINVEETKPFFFLVDTRPVLREDHGPSRFEYSDDDFGSESKDAAVGFRWFVGRRGILHAGVLSQNDQLAFTRAYSAVAAGYTQYDLFGTRAFVTLNVRLPEGRLAEGTISPQLIAGVPLSASQTVTIDFQDTHFRNDKRHIGGVEIPLRDAERLLSMSWTYNTTNHPFAPTRGTILRVTPLRAMRDRSQVSQVLSDLTPVPAVRHSNAWGLDVAASRYWELSERNAVSAGVLAGWADVGERTSGGLFDGARMDSRPAYQVVRGGYSRNLWKTDSKKGDSRLELDVRFMKRQINVDGPDRIGDNDKVYQTSVAWVRRSSWGMARLGIGYAWGE
jgi:outer membrane protein assembly factor BamA